MQVVVTVVMVEVIILLDLVMMEWRTPEAVVVEEEHLCLRVLMVVEVVLDLS